MITILEKDAADTLGIGGVYFDPLWRVPVELTPLEQDLLGSWWVRRLAFIAHAGAAAITTTQTYSRLEHSLGVMSLVVHFAPHDETARTAALLHDIGHLPFSHTFEGLRGLDHHRLGRQRVESLEALLERHGVTSKEVMAVEEGAVVSSLRGPQGRLRLDHLDSILRSGQAHGRTRTAPPDILAHLRLVDGAVDTDADTARELTRLIVAEARAQRSPANVIAYAMMRRMADSLLDRQGQAAVAEMTDDEFWCALLADPEVGDVARRFRRAPLGWATEPMAAGSAEGADGSMAPPGAFVHEIRRSYLDLPTVDGAVLERPPDIDALLNSLPSRHRVWPVSSTT